MLADSEECLSHVSSTSRQERKVQHARAPQGKPTSRMETSWAQLWRKGRDLLAT